jgi:uncharacterized protein (UPF0264 family)
LVSVVSEAEVASAVEGGADIIDVKNPAEGALGANFPHVIRGVCKSTPLDREVSATIGDVPNLPGTVSLAALGAAVCGVQYVKVGLLGTQTPRDAVFLLREVCRAVRSHSPSTRIIAAAYADAHKVNSILPLALPNVAAEAGANGCLLDTYVKGEGTLFSNLSDSQLRNFVAQCRGARLLCGLAGALGAEDIPHVCKFEADLVGVRTAACRGDRKTGQVDSHKVRRLKELISANESPGWTLSPRVPSNARGRSR